MFPSDGLLRPSGKVEAGRQRLGIDSDGFDLESSNRLFERNSLGAGDSFVFLLR